MSKETGYQPPVPEYADKRCEKCGFLEEDGVCWNCKYREKDQLPQDERSTPSSREDKTPHTSK